MFSLQEEETGGSGERTAVSRILGQVYCPDKDVPATGRRDGRFIVLTRMFPLQEEETGDSGERTAVSRILEQVYCPDLDVPATADCTISDIRTSLLPCQGRSHYRTKRREVADKFVALSRTFSLQDEETRGSGELTALSRILGQVCCPDKDVPATGRRDGRFIDLTRMFPLQEEETRGSGELTAVSRILGQVCCPDKDVPATRRRGGRKKRREVAVSGLQYLRYWDRFIVLTRMFPLQEEDI
ncbi:hypothetical protein J6590_027548 [Homalodisca vitripennis]|nr:hypothetical protein J6590_027548 [Homalodisca vitripennis]